MRVSVCRAARPCSASARAWAPSSPIWLELRRAGGGEARRIGGGEGKVVEEAIRACAMGPGVDALATEEREK